MRLLTFSQPALAAARPGFPTPSQTLILIIPNPEGVRRRDFRPRKGGLSRKLKDKRHGLGKLPTSTRQQRWQVSEELLSLIQCGTVDKADLTMVQTATIFHRIGRFKLPFGRLSEAESEWLMLQLNSNQGLFGRDAADGDEVAKGELRAATYSELALRTSLTRNEPDRVDYPGKAPRGESAQPRIDVNVY